MTRRSKRELERALHRLVEADDTDVSVVITIGDGAPDDWGYEEPSIDDEMVSMIYTEHVEELEVRGETKRLVHHEVHTPLTYTASRDPRHSGIVFLSDVEIAHLWLSMPPEVANTERELREERGEPIPPILEEVGR